jgi:hypothetical protein
MNNLQSGLEHLVASLKLNTNIVCIRLQNNNIDGRKCTQSIYELIKNHQSLTAVDLGNSESIKNRNRLYSEGLNALIDGIVDSECSLISELNLQAANINTLQPLLKLPKKVDLQILDVS